jgi:hypothetical protein
LCTRLEALVATTTVALLAAVASAAEAAVDAVDAVPTIERVALFKNGLGFIESSVVLPEGARVVRLGQLPIPSHGTFWLSHDPDVPVRGLVTSLESVTLPAPVQDQAELLRQNAGRQVSIQTDSGTIEGTVVASPRGELQQPPSPYVMDTLRTVDARGNPVSYPSSASGPLVLVKTADGLASLSTSAIRSVRFGGGDAVTEATVTRRRPSMRLELAEPAGGRTVGLSCLARGITWVPSYRIDLTDPATARVTGKAVVVNELADLDGVAVELVTGFPNVLFGEVQAPEAMAQNLDGFLTSLARGRDENNRRGTLYLAQTRAPLHNAAGFDDDEAAPAPGYSLTMAGTATEDLFFYPLANVRLRRGETASLTLFTGDMPYRHLYTWRIPDRLDDNARDRGGMSPSGRKGEARAEEVWHCCRLTNVLTMPLTTAAAEFVTAGRFTGQDVCYYTAPRESTTIRINRAMNVVAEAVETETERKRDAATFGTYRYSQVSVRGELRLISRLATEATIEVTKELSGDVLETTPKATDVATARGLGRVNPRHVLTWEAALKAGGELKLAYVYQVYVYE